VSIVGVGNRMRADDGAGPVLIDRVKDNVAATCIDAGITPENYLEKVVVGEPDTILIVDAGHFGGQPGDTRMFQSSEIAAAGVSTHTLSLELACDYLKNRISANVFLIAIQPEMIEWKEALSESVDKAVDDLARTLVGILSADESEAEDDA